MNSEQAWQASFDDAKMLDGRGNTTGTPARPAASRSSRSILAKGEGRRIRFSGRYFSLVGIRDIPIYMWCRILPDRRNHKLLQEKLDGKFLLAITLPFGVVPDCFAMRARNCI